MNIHSSQESRCDPTEIIEITKRSPDINYSYYQVIQTANNSDASNIRAKIYYNS